MTNKLQRGTPKAAMVCPCCGEAGSLEKAVCPACGARRVAEPLARPDALLPSLGGSLAALGASLAVIMAFLMAWVFGNDLKVGRVFVVWLFGDGLKVTREMLQLDPKLPYYNIFSYDAYRLASYLAVVMIPLSLLGVWLARRARRRIAADPVRFGGRRIANASMALSTMLTLAFSAAVISSIPRAIEQGREKHAAATRASMYQIGRVLREFNNTYGRYPEDRAELQAFSREPLPQLDYWENQISYTPGALVASRGSAPGFSDYKLVSPGPDGLLGTADDIVLQDGVIVSPGAESDLWFGFSAPEKSQK
ncbi:MAG TPA: hypothetical protein VFD58_29190 [Blastocatellia bacterium]|nr:hypothetical protein [Blastocatellia bacterium]